MAVLGISRTFQNIRLFKEITVIQNLLVALDNNPNSPRNSVLAKIFRTQRFLSNEIEKFDRALHLLELLGLAGRSQEVARSLPYGDQRRLEIARALATGAKLVLLDEPAAGMTSEETEKLMQTIRYIRDTLQVTVLLIEHDMELVMGICERIAVLDYGKKISEGTPSEVQRDPRVIAAYLGTSKEC